MPTRRKSRSEDGDALSTYRAKRAFGRTPEPGGLAPKAAPRPGGLLIVHMHDATRLHWDLRLELNGVLMSWAVPKGPSANPADKRLAVKVEDHPLEYGDFEGIIPEGNYGAGTVIVWDRGIWVPLEDVQEGFEKGKLLFELRGYKLHGRWTLIKLKKTPKEWLLIKERDEYVSTEPYSNESVLSGLTNDELSDAKQRAEPIKKELEKLGAPKRNLRVEDTELMLAETRDQPFSKAGWLFEVKLDGYRMRAACQNGEAILYSRKGLDFAGAFPELARAIKAIPYENVILDGELVVLNESGHPSFSKLQARAKLSGRADVKRAAIEAPATLFVFDLLAFAGYDLRKLPLIKRKEILQKVLPQAGPLRYSEHFEKNGEALYEQVVNLGLEGIVAKKMDSPYRNGRSADWLKIRADRIDDFVVVGFSKPKGSRGGFGSLHVGAYKDGRLIYCGRAGSGFSGNQLAEISATLQALVRKTPPCDPPENGALPKGADHTWVEPRLVCDVRYKEFTTDGLLRQSVFVRFRDDKKPEDVMMPGEAGDGRGEKDAPVTPERTSQLSPLPREVKLSNLDKVFWPEEGYTKGDLIEYYRSMGPWLLPYLKNRPVVLTRYPDGINGKSFYQKDAPGFVPEWIQTVGIWSEDTQRDIQYFVANDIASLTYLVNLGTIPLHIWMSRIDDLTRPDWCLIDLDPKEAPFANVVTLAKTMQKLCEDVDMPAFIKTTGKSGLHIMLPLGRQLTYDQCLQLAMLFARLVTDQHPDIATTTRAISKRAGKVYVDAFQNRAGQLMVAPYSVRPSPKAPVSMPIEWDEVNGKLHNTNFTIANALKRMEKLGHDPVLPVLDLKPNLVGVLERLNERLE